MRDAIKIGMAILMAASCKGADSDTTVPPPAAASAAAAASWSAALPSWLTLGAEERGRLDTFEGLNGVPGKDYTYYLHRFRLNAGFKIYPWLKLFLQGQDSRVVGYGRPVPYNVADTFDLRQAYVEIGVASENSWKGRIGRQPLIFGDMRLVSTSNWGNVGPNYDGVSLTRTAGALRVDAFYTYVVIPEGHFNTQRPDKRLAGLYSSWKLRKAGPVLEAYWFWKHIT